MTRFHHSRRDGLLRLAHLAEQTEAHAETMHQERQRFTRLAAREPAKVITSFNLFQTPPTIAAKMAAIIGPTAGRHILEPSAGLGRLYEATDRQGEFTFVESSAQCCEHLYTLGPRLIQADFLTCDLDRLGGPFDAVIMNPPFKNGRDIKHIRHAFTLLRPGGMLVSLCFNGVKQNQHLRPLVDSWDVLPAGSFKSEGTRAEVAIVTWRKS